MGKYSFDRLSPDTFEALLKALLQQEFGVTGDLIVFGPGKDGGREATWSQAKAHPKYVRPQRLWRQRTGNTDHEWVFQVKFYDTVRARSKHTLDVLIEDLNSELEKIAAHHQVPCDTYVLITNLPLTGARYVGGRDRIAKAIRAATGKLPAGVFIERVWVWDAAYVSAMLDAHPNVRRTYLDSVLPSDLIAAMLDSMQRQRSSLVASLRAYLDKVLKTATKAKSDEAGDDSDSDLRLEDVYIDLTLRLKTDPKEAESGDAASVWSTIANSHTRSPGAPPNGAADMWSASVDLFTVAHSLQPIEVPASLATLLATTQVTLLEAGPGFGKSTICQFVVTYHASRLCGSEKADIAQRLGRRMKCDIKGILATQLDSMCRPRLPFRIELRRYAEWRTSPNATGITQYIAEKLVNVESDATLTKEDIYDTLRSTPSLIVLDGLDEVPNLEVRTTIVDDVEIFLRRIRSEHADVQMLLSTRPQGYNQEFEPLAPVTWTITNLSPVQFYEYCDLWLLRRVEDVHERGDALARIKGGMVSPEVSGLAFTLLQATVILTVAKNKHDIPRERSSLFSKYVDVIFTREKSKFELVKRYESELRHLHALTGYESHRMMELKQSGTIPEGRFRDLVRRIWDTYRGREPLPKGLTSVVDEICVAAKNRLVFLKGEGDNQSEIGFLISSFREFFAALYIHTDDNADRDKVFSALLRRDSHWENVLLFYGGFQNTRDQKQWIEHLSDRQEPESRRALELVHQIRFRRMLLKLMPEFRLLKHHTLLSAFQEIFHASTLSTWTGVKWAPDLICLLHGGALLPAVIDRFRELACDSSEAVCAAALILLGEISTRSERGRDALAGSLIELVNRKQHVSIAVEISIRFNVPIDLSNAPDEDCVSGAYRSGPGPLPRRAIGHASDRLPRMAFLELLLRGGVNCRSETMQSFLKTTPKETAFRSVRAVKGFRISLKPVLAGGYCPTDSALHYRPTDLVSALELHPNDQSKAARFVASLAAAAMSPFDAVLDDTARALETDLGFSLRPSYECNSVLGPRVDSFASREDWQKFRDIALRRTTRGGWMKEVRALRRKAVASQSKELELFWLIFAIHPRAWPRLVENAMVSDAMLTRVRLHGLGTLLAIPKRAIDVVDRVRMSAIIDLREMDVSLARILRFAIRVAKDYGAECLAPCSWLVDLVAAAIMRGSTAAEFVELCDLMNDISGAHLDWTFMLFLLGLKTDGSDVDRLLSLWKRVSVAPRKISLGRHGYIRLRRLLSELLRERSGDEEVLLSVWVVASCQISPTANLRRRATKLFSQLLLRSNLIDAWFYVVVEALCRLPLSFSECAVWKDAGCVARLKKDRRLLEAVCRRVRVDSGVLRPVPETVAALAEIVETAEDLSAELAAAAAESLRALVSAYGTALDEREWQSGSLSKERR